MKKILVIGSLNMDYVVRIDTPPTLGETVLADNLQLIPGGKGANQAFTLGQLGSDVKMLGAVGDDENGRVLLESLSGVDVDISKIKIEKQSPTGLAMIVINKKGENQIIVVAGANNRVTKKYIDNNRKSIEEADIILVQLEIPMDTVEHIINIAYSLEKTIILDPAPITKKISKNILSKIDYIKPNITELATLTGMDVSEENHKPAVENLRSQGVSCVLATLGSSGVYVDDGISPFRLDSIKVKAVDTTAAGDAFIATFTSFLAKGEEISMAVEKANIFASMVVTKKGAQLSIPTLDKFLKQYNKQTS